MIHLSSFLEVQDLKNTTLDFPKQFSAQCSATHGIINMDTKFQHAFLL